MGHRRACIAPNSSELTHNWTVLYFGQTKNVDRGIGASLHQRLYPGFSREGFDQVVRGWRWPGSLCDLLFFRRSRFSPAQHAREIELLHYPAATDKWP